MARPGRWPSSRATTAPARSTPSRAWSSLTGRSPFTRLVYPVPEPGGLGVHFIRALTDTMAYLPPDETWRNRLQMKKRVG